jgi:hypothetical protein
MPEQHVKTGDAHLADDDHNWFPERTMPQGTQENGVDFQHEDRDMNYGGVIRWLVSLAVGVVIVFLAIAGAFYFLGEREKEVHQMPSPVFALHQDPPEPRLIPNPWEQPEGAIQVTPFEYRDRMVKTENEQLEKVGLLDGKTELPKLPPSAQDVLTELNRGATVATPGQVPGTEMYPSGMSGGTRNEDRLR